MKAEDILYDNFDSEYYAGETYGDFAYPAETVIKAMEKYGEEVLKIAAEKAKTKKIYTHIDLSRIGVDKESILNCLKDK